MKENEKNSFKNEEARLAYREIWNNADKVIRENEKVIDTLSITLSIAIFIQLITIINNENSINFLSNNKCLTIILIFISIIFISISFILPYIYISQRHKIQEKIHDMKNNTNKKYSEKDFLDVEYKKIKTCKFINKFIRLKLNGFEIFRLILFFMVLIGWICYYLYI